MFMDKTVLEREYLIEGVLPGLLAELTHPAPTRLLVNRIARRLDLADKASTASVASILTRYIALRHPNATHDGDTFKFYGVESRRWRWHPTPQVTAADLMS